MAAFVIGIQQESATDPGWFAAYRDGIEATMAPYGGRYRILTEHRIAVLEGDWRPPLGLVAVEFPSFDQALAWYHSPEYAPLRALRLANIRFDVILVDGLAEGETLLAHAIPPPAHAP